MAYDLYKETFSHVRSSYKVNVEDFEKMKTKKSGSVKKILLIAAAVAVLAALGVTAAATDFFGLRAVSIPGEDGDGGLISMQGFADSPEGRALHDYYYGGLTLEEAAEKYGLTVPERCEVYGYDTVKELLGGELMDERNSRWSFIVYEDGTFSADQEFTASDGTAVSYQMYRAVKGSLTEVTLNGDAFGEDCEEWDVKIGSRDVGLVLGGGDRSLIIADLGDSFFAANVLSGKRADPTFGGPVTREQLEELAKSLNWDVLSRVAAPELPPPEPEVQFGAGVELLPRYIDEGQSFDVELPYYGKTRFVTYLPTEEFNDVRFFLTSDGKVSDYEFHPMFDDNTSVSVAAVSFEDLDGDGNTDVLALVDHENTNGAATRRNRAIRLFRYSGDGEFELEQGMMYVYDLSDPDCPDTAAVREMAKQHFADGGDNDPDKLADSVVSSLTLCEGDRTVTLEAIGREGPYAGHWGIREINLYDCDENGVRRAEPFQTIAVTDAGEDYVSGILVGYTECWSREDTLTVLDMNFDGYADIGVFGWVTNNTIPYYYWFWNEDAGRFEYAIRLQGAVVDWEHRQVVTEFKSGPAGSEYIRDYYTPDEDGTLRHTDTKKFDYSAYYTPWGEPYDFETVLSRLQSAYTGSWPLTYGLFDLTGDGKDELIAEYGNNEADAECGVWSADTGAVKKIGSFAMGHSELYTRDGKLLRFTAHMGHEEIAEIGFDGAEVTETVLSARDLGPEDDYTSPDAPLLVRAPDYDLSLLHPTGKYDCYAAVLDRAGTDARYTLFDLELDGVRELIVAEGGEWRFWTLEGGEEKLLGALDSTKSSLYEDEGHSLILYYSNMSGAELRRVYFDGEKMDTVYLTGWEWREGVAGEDPGEALTFLPATDRSALG